MQLHQHTGQNSARRLPRPNGKDPAPTGERECAIADLLAECRPTPPEWHSGHPYVRRLHQHLVRLLEEEKLSIRRKLVAYLIGRCEDDGTLPCAQNKLSPGAIARILGLKHEIFMRCGTGRFFRSLAPFFGLEIERPSMEDSPDLPMTERVRRYVSRNERDDVGLPAEATPIWSASKPSRARSTFHMPD